MSVGVSIRELVVKFDETVAVDHVTLEVGAGELLALIGPSGCGKTTLLRAVAGFARPDAGSLRFGTEDVTRVAPHRRNAGMVFQSLALWPHMTVAENVAFGLRERRVPTREIAPRVEEALATTRLGGYGGRHIEQLSGGEQQRVALARALVVRPRCLLLDEPLSSLDARLRRSMREEIRTLCKTHGLTTLYVTHDQEEALAVADRVAVMRAGRLLQLGTPAEVYRRPCSHAVATFVGETNLIEGHVLSHTDGLTKIECGLGVLSSTAPASFSRVPGSRVLVSIRPESLHPPTGALAANRFDAEALSATFLGPSVERRLRVGDVVMTMTEPGTGDVNPPGPAAAAAVDVAGDFPQPWPPSRRIVEVAYEDVVLLPPLEDDPDRQRAGEPGRTT